MFFEHITDSVHQNGLLYLNSRWCVDIPGLVRVPFFDYTNPSFGYVVFYSEIKQEYGIVKFQTENGNICWTKSVCNGGYGTPAVYGDILVCHKEFNSIIAIDKETSQELWEIKTQGRIRTSISIYSEFCFFASAGIIYKVNQEGVVIETSIADGVFFYGNIVKYNSFLLILGVEYNPIIQQSILSVYCYDINLKFKRKIELSSSPVVSADTSGLFCVERYAIVACYDTIFKIDIVNMQVVFQKKAEGITCRHIPISDGSAIYYTTLNGFVSAISLLDGRTIWRRKMNESSIVAPPSLKGQSIVVIADGYINILNKYNGEILQSKVIGHAPYSAAILFNNKVFLGGGEPPIYGNLLCFEFVPQIQLQKDLFSVKILNESVDSRDKTLLIKTNVDSSEISVNPSAIAEEINVYAIPTGNCSFKASFTLKNNCIKGYYGIPIKLTLNHSKESINTMFRLELHSLNSLPPKVFLQNFACPIKQEGELYSGAAIAQLLMAYYGKQINQRNFREIIDYVKVKSGWKDADFQTWRLILKRVLSNPHYTLDDFIKSEKKSQ